MLLAQNNEGSLLEDIRISSYEMFQKSIADLDSANAIEVCQVLKLNSKSPLYSFYAANFIALSLASKEDQKELAVDEMIRAVNKIEETYTVFEKGEIHFHASGFYNLLTAQRSAIDHLSKSIDLFELIDRYDRLADCWNINGHILYQVGDYQNAILDLKIALDYYFKTNENERPKLKVYSTYNTIALSYRNMDHLDSAIHYFDQALDWAQKDNDRYWTALIGANKSTILRAQEKYAEARHLLLADVSISLEFGLYESAANALVNIADLHLSLGEIDSAKIFLEEVVRICMLGENELPVEYFHVSSKYYEAISNYKKSLEQLSKYIFEMESQKVTIKQAADVIKTRFDYNLDLVKMKLEKSLLNEKNQERQIRQQRLWILMIGIFLLISLVQLLAYLRKNKTVREALATIEQLNEKLISSNLNLKQSNEDLTLEKEKLNKAVEKLEKAQEQILRNDRMTSLGILTRGISHEINNPLNLISLGLEVIQTKEHLIDSNEKNQLLTGMSEGVSRLSQIVRNLGEFSKDSSKREICDIEELIENSLGILSHDISQMGLTVLKEYYHEPLSIMGYSGELHQVILNLLSKCMHSMHSMPKILSIRTFIDNSYACIYIHDNGRGLKSEALSQIFDPFYMIDEGEPGLYLVHRFVENNNGKISCTSKEFEGLEFHLRLPINY